MKLEQLRGLLWVGVVLWPFFAAAQVPRLGGEFQVNEFTLGAQEAPAAACDANGNAVLAWQGRPTGNDHDLVNGIFFRRYDAFGMPLGSENEVSPHPPCSLPRVFPEICRDAAGNAVVVYQQFPGSDLRGVRFNSTGMQLGTEFQVAGIEATSSYTLPYFGGHDVACEDTGEFIVAWMVLEDSGLSDGNVLARRFDTMGTAVGTEFQVNSFSGASFPSVASDDDGDFVVAWTQSIAGGGIGNPVDVRARRFDSSGTSAGSEFLVNTYTLGLQVLPSVASDQNGDFVIAWVDGFSTILGDGQDGDYGGIFAQLYASSGAPVGTEFPVNQFTVESQSLPSAAMDSNGNFVIAWESDTQDGDYTGVFARRFASGGGALGGEFQVNLYTPGRQSVPAAGREDSGNFIVSWTDSPSLDGSGSGIFARRFDSAGIGLTGDFQVNSYTVGDQGPNFFGPPSMSFGGGLDAACDSSCGVTWMAESGVSPLFFDVFAQLYDSAGSPSSPEVSPSPGLCDTTREGPAACRNPDTGTFVIVWAELTADYYSFLSRGVKIRGQRYDDDGAEVGTEFRVSSITSGIEIAPSVACRDDDSFVVVWQDPTGRYGSPPAILGRRFGSGGNPVGADFVVNAFSGASQESPDVAADDNGNFVVVWERYGDPDGIFGQRYDGTGATVGSEFKISTYTSADQGDPAVAARADGTFVVAWDSFDQDASGEGVFGRRFDSAGGALGNDFLVNTYTLSGQYLADVSMASDASFIVTWQGYRGGNGFDARLQQFDSAGNKVGTELQVNTFTLGDQDYVTHCAAADGDHFIVAWESGENYQFFSSAQGGGAQAVVETPEPEEQDGEHTGIFAQAFGSTATVTPTSTTTPTETPTETPTRTATQTLTATPTGSMTPTPTATGSATETGTATETPTATPSGTTTPTQTPTSTPPVTPVITSGPGEGSTTVGGMGQPNLGPTCLRVFEVGANGVPDNGQPDDEFLGQGGTDAMGNFSIMLNRPLVDGDVIYVLDVCFNPDNPLAGPLLAIFGPAPAPALSREMMLFAMAVLSGIALFGIRRRARLR